jgi:hypothetical protein
VPLLFVEFLDLDVLSRLVDCAFLALSLTFLDLAVDGFPMLGCAVLAEAPFLELTLELALAVDELEANPSMHALMFWTLTSLQNCVSLPYGP